MPFGIDKQLGGDNKENDMWMEKCVKKVKASGKDEGSAIAICKAVMRKTMHNKMKASYILEKDIIEEYNSLIGDNNERL